MHPFRRFIQPSNAAVAIPAGLSLLGTFYFLGGDRETLLTLLSDRWSLLYLILTPFLHAGFAHFLLNTLAMNFLGGQMLLPLLGNKRFLKLMLIAIITGHLANNLLSNAPSIGISAAVMGLLACSLYPFGRLPMKFLFIHDIFRLPAFPLHYIAIFLVILDITGLILGWRFFAHAAHLGGFFAGLIYGKIAFHKSSS